MAQSIGKLAAQLTLDTSAFLSGFRSAVEGAKGFNKQLDRLNTSGARRFTGGVPGGGGAAAFTGGGRGGGGMMGGMVGAGLSRFAGYGLSRFAGPAAAVAGAVASVHQLGKAMEEVDRSAKLSDRLGVTHEMMERLSVAASASGTDVEVLTKAMLHMGRTIGSGDMPLDKRLFQVADAIAAIEDPARRSAAAVRIFGRQGDELHALITNGSRGIKRSTDAIDRFGLSISRIDARKVEEANDAITELGVVLGGFGRKLAVEISPMIESFVKDQLDVLLVMKKEFVGLRGELARAILPGMDSKAAEKHMTEFVGTLFNPIGSILRSGDRLKTLFNPGRNAAAPGANNQQRGLGGAIGGLSGRMSGGGLLEKGTVAAAEAIASAGGSGSPLKEIDRTLKELLLIEKNKETQRERDRRKKEVSLKASSM